MKYELWLGRDRMLFSSNSAADIYLDWKDASRVYPREMLRIYREMDPRELRTYVSEESRERSSSR